MKGKLNTKQQFFCKEYLIDFNATQAAIRAGYSKKTAGQIGESLLKKVETQRYISELKNKLSNKLEISLEKVVAEYAKIAFTDIRDYYDDDSLLKPIKDLSDNAAAALAGVEVDQLWGASMDGKIQIGETKKIKRWDKVKALDSLCKVLGFNAAEKLEVKNDIKVTLNLE